MQTRTPHGECKSFNGYHERRSSIHTHTCDFRFLVVVASTVNAYALACAMHRRRGWAGEGQPRGIAVDAVQSAFLEPLLGTINRSMEALLPPCLSHWRQTLVQHYQLLTDGRFLSHVQGLMHSSRTVWLEHMRQSPQITAALNRRERFVSIWLSGASKNRKWLHKH